MNSIRKILILTFVTITSNFSFAQTTSTPEERAKYWDDWMKKEVLITPDREAEVHAINLKYAQLNEQLKTTETTRRSKFEEMKLNEEKKEKELKVILTKDQFKRYQQKKKAMQKKMLQNMRNN